METIKVAAVSMNSPFGAQDEVMDRIESPPVDHPNPPYHAGGAMIIEPAGTILVHAQLDRIRDEMVVGTLDPARLAEARSRANYTPRTRRPELFGELVRDRLSG